MDGVNYFFTRKFGIYFVATTKHNTSPSMVHDIIYRMMKVFRDYCGILNEESIRKTISSEVFVRESEAEILAAGSRNPWGIAPEQWREKALVGTPEQVSEKIQRYIDAGCTGFIPWCPDYPGTETLTLFAEKVIPNFR